MANARDLIGKAGVVLAGGFFRIAFYVCVAVLIFWLGKSSFQFGYHVFNQQPMNPGNGQEVTVVIKDASSVYKIGKTLEKKGLVESAFIFCAQEMFSNYRGELKPGTYLLSTAYTPNRIMGILAGDEEQEGAETS